MNLVIFKACLALLVIYSHIALYSDVPIDNIFSRSGGLAAVNIFFFISAYFLTHKYSSDITISKEVVSRFKRLIPAGIIASILVGLLLSINTDISLINLISITFKNGVYAFGIDYNYICAFSCEPGGEKLNSSLWSMPFELLFTLALIPFIHFGFRQKNFLSLLLFLFLILIAITIFIDLASFNGEGILMRASRVIFWFFFGVVIAAVSLSDKPIQPILIGFVIFLLLIGVVFINTMWICMVIFMAAVFKPNSIKIVQKFMTKNRPQLDPTYGAYLIGFPVQQLLFWQFGITDIESLFFLTSVVSITYGLFSNRYLETFSQ